MKRPNAQYVTKCLVVLSLVTLSACGNNDPEPAVPEPVETLAVSFQSPRWALPNAPSPDDVPQYFWVNGEAIVAKFVDKRDVPEANTSWYGIDITLPAGHHFILPTAEDPANPTSQPAYASTDERYSPVAIDRGNIVTQLCFDLKNLVYGVFVEHEEDDGPIQVVGDALNCAQS